jgi:hypothetical protein
LDGTSCSKGEPLFGDLNAFIALQG